MKHSRTIPDIEEEKAPRSQVQASPSEGREHIGILELIAEHSEHHQSGIEMPLKIDAANISLLDDNPAVT